MWGKVAPLSPPGSRGREPEGSPTGGGCLCPQHRQEWEGWGLADE